MMIRQKIKWTPAFKREFPLLMVYIANEGYIRNMKDEIGWSFRDTLFVIRDGIEQSYRSEDDFDLIKKFLITIKNKDNFLKQVYNKIVDYSRHFKELSEACRKEGLEDKSNKELLSIFIGLCQYERKLNSVLQVPVYFEIALRKTCTKKTQRQLKEVSKIRGKAADLLFKTYGEDYSGFLSEFGRRFSLEACLVKCMLPDEIEKSLKSKEGQLVVYKNILKQRFKLSVLVTINKKTELFIGAKAKKFIKKYIETIGKTTEIKGMIAYPGKVCGKVMLVIGKGDFPKIKSKDILVAPTTSIHYVPYIRKVAAIITDEGGLTCHASLISREMKIPCIIGTKIATKVLKDGDLIEVDANKGIVRIIK